MANIPIYPGSSSFTPGDTPFGFYDYDFQFQSDADKVVTFCARRLGYPLTDVELQDVSFYTAFEEAITTYGNELYAYQVRDNLLSLEGASTSSIANNSVFTPNMGGIIRLAQQYGEEAGVGGNVTYYSGSIALTASIQDYDLTQWALDNNISGGIEIKQIFYYPLPAINQLYAPYGGFAGLGGVPSAGLYGGGMLGSGYGVGYLMMPLSYDLGTMQAIEMSNTVRLSNYTFQLINNKLRIFPIPSNSDTRGGRLWFNYIKVYDRANNGLVSTGGVNNVSNAPYTNPTYAYINSIGRQWIFEYTLALCKEMLGYIRGKYSTIPIPDREVTLNQSDLLVAATAEKQALVERLRAYFDETSKKALLERRAQESDFRKQEINNVPMVIYIG
jgi:hypothetical protein